MWPKLILQAWWAVLTPTKHLGHSETQKWAPGSFQNRLTPQNSWFFWHFQKNMFLSISRSVFEFQRCLIPHFDRNFGAVGMEDQKIFFGPNLVPMAKNVHFHHPSPGPKMKMFATPRNLDSMIFTEEKCHVFIIYLQKYWNVSFRGPNGPKTKNQGFWPLFLVVFAGSETLLHH